MHSPMEKTSGSLVFKILGNHLCLLKRSCMKPTPSSEADTPPTSRGWAGSKCCMSSHGTPVNLSRRYVPGLCPSMITRCSSSSSSMAACTSQGVAHQNLSGGRFTLNPRTVICQCACTLAELTLNPRKLVCQCACSLPEFVHISTCASAQSDKSGNTMSWIVHVRFLSGCTCCEITKKVGCLQWILGQKC